MSKTQEQSEPKPPFPPQGQERPGLDAEMNPRPKHSAPLYKGSGKLQGKTALITGGDSGIGASVAILFAREGADVASSTCRSRSVDAEHVKRHVEAEGTRCLLIPGDVKKSTFCTEAVEKTVKEFGKLDVLVNNAAVMKQRQSLDEITDEELDETFRTNIYGYFYMARGPVSPETRLGHHQHRLGRRHGGAGQAPRLRGDQGGDSCLHQVAFPDVNGQGHSRELRGPRPGLDPLNASARSEQDMAEYGGKVPMGRPGQPEEIAPAYVFFASEADSSYISGEVLSLYGGKTQAG